MDILVKHLNKSYNDLRVLEDYSCHFKEKKITCLMGPSGSGKTTLINILLGLQKPDSGTVEGIPYGRLSAVFQEDRLCDNLSAMANLKLVCKRGVDEQQLRQGMIELGLSDAFHIPARELSGGMRRRVAILRALLAESKCIIMDEPFKGLDEETKEMTIAYVLRHVADKTLIVITHDPREAEVLGADIVNLHKK